MEGTWGNENVDRALHHLRRKFSLHWQCESQSTKMATMTKSMGTFERRLNTFMSDSEVGGQRKGCGEEEGREKKEEKVFFLHFLV